jgi:hypothetical protein
MTFGLNDLARIIDQDMNRLYLQMKIYRSLRLAHGSIMYYNENPNPALAEIAMEQMFMAYATYAEYNELGGSEGCVLQIDRLMMLIGTSHFTGE